MELPREQAGPSRGVPLVSFGAPPDDRTASNTPAQQTQQPPAKQRCGAGRRADAPAHPGPCQTCRQAEEQEAPRRQPRDGGGCSLGDGERTTSSPGGGPGR